MSQPVRFAILSFAHFHAESWAQAAQASAHAALVGIWDDNESRGRTAAEKYSVPFHTEIDSLLSECDAVGVTSETVKHADLIEVVAKAGKHILCEKPIATSNKDCVRIENAVADSGVYFMQNFPKRFDPINHELMKIAESGDLGQIRQVRVRHGHYHGLDDGFQQQWFTDPTLSGGGTLLDEGVHAADFLLWLLGMPDSVMAFISNDALQLAVEDSAHAVFRYGDGTIADVSTSWTYVAADQSIEIYGTKGTLLLSGVDLASKACKRSAFLRVYRRDTDEWKESETEPIFVTRQFHQQGPIHFFESIRHGNPPTPGIDVGRQTLKMIMAAYDSAQRKCETEVSACHAQEN